MQQQHVRCSSFARFVSQLTVSFAVLRSSEIRAQPGAHFSSCVHSTGGHVIIKLALESPNLGVLMPE